MQAQTQTQIQLTDVQLNICNAIKAQGGTAFLVGGMVRDALMNLHWGTNFGNQEVDADFEVFNVTQEQLTEILSMFGKVETSGERYVVTRVRIKGEQQTDWSLPRRERKTGKGHGDFEVTAVPNMSFWEASSRRDVTINSLMWNPLTGELIDCHNGVNHIRNRILKHTSSAFSEDWLRVLRLFQMAGRFGMDVHADTIELCKPLLAEIKELFESKDPNNAKARASIQKAVRQEIEKWASKSIKPSLGLWFLKDCEWLEFIFPEVARLVDVPQDRLWHPEGGVFTHVCHVCDGVAHQGGDMVDMFAALAHDVGKAPNTWLQPKTEKAQEDRIHWSEIADWKFAQLSTFQFEHGDEEWRWRSPGHDVAGAPIAQQMIERWFMDEDQKKPCELAEQVAILTKAHMNHIGFIEHKSRKRIRTLSRKLAEANVTLRRLEILVNADSNGRPFDANKFVPNPDMVIMMAMATEMDLEEKPPVALLTGKDLIMLGLKPGEVFGEIIRASEVSQDNEEFTTKDGAILWFLANKSKWV